MRALLPTIFLCLCALSVQAASDAACLRQPLDLELHRQGNTVDIRISNCSDFPVTASLYLNSPNLRTDAPNARAVVTVPANRQIGAMRARIADTNRHWNQPPFMDWTWGNANARHDDDYRYRLPFAPRATFRILQGYHGSFSHDGLESYTIDFDMPVGTPVYAARQGTVVKVVKHNDKGCFEAGCGNHANYIVVMHADGTTGEYYHLQKNGAIVTPGEYIRRGQHIGYSGNTGHTALRHLHFGVYRPVGWGKTESIPTRFATDKGMLENLQQWAWYRVPASDGTGTGP